MNSSFGFKFLMILAVAGQFHTALGEIKIIEASLPAKSTYVQYVSGYLIAPGYVDLSNVIFMADSSQPSMDVDMNTQFDDVVSAADDDKSDVGKATMEPTASPVASAPDVSVTDDTATNEENENENENGNVAPTEDEASVSGDGEDEAAPNGDEDEPSVSGDGEDSDSDSEDAPNGDANEASVSGDGEDEDSPSEDANEPVVSGDGEDSNSDSEDATNGDANEASVSGDGDEYYSDSEDEPSGDENEASVSGDGEDGASPSENENEASVSGDGDEYYSNSEDEPSEDENEASVSGDGEDEDTDDYYGGHRRLARKESVVDVLFFHEPADCVKTTAGCDWTKLGIGAKDNEDNVHFCCSETAVASGYCEQTDFGQIIVEESLFTGVHRPVLIPATGSFQGTVDTMMNTHDGTGTYTLVFANCYDYGRDITLIGNYEWKSKGGFLPGDLFSEWHFLNFLTVCYCGILFWYARSMSAHKNSTIGIQKWILGTIALAVLELFFRSCDYFEWNKSGLRKDGVMYLWISFGVLKGSISRCLLVMVSLGWGVIRDTLGDAMIKIIMLGILYGSLAFMRDATEIWFVEEMQTLSEEESGNIYDLFTILTFVTSFIDVTFYMWILDSLNSTMQYLENMNQNMKLKRYLRLRLMLLFSILFGVIWAIFGIVDKTMDDSILSEGQDWILRAMWYVNYTFVLVCIALLWKPDPRAKEFAYVMELPSIGDDMILETNIDSPDDFDDDDGVNVSYSDVEKDDRFTIADAVPS